MLGIGLHTILCMPAGLFGLSMVTTWSFWPLHGTYQVRLAPAWLQVTTRSVWSLHGYYPVCLVPTCSLPGLSGPYMVLHGHNLVCLVPT